MQSIVKNDDYILNVNKEEYIQYLISEFWIDPIDIHSDQLTVRHKQYAGHFHLTYLTCNNFRRFSSFALPYR